MRAENKNYLFFNYVSNLRKIADSAPIFVFKLPDSSLGNVLTTTVILSAEQQHRSIVESNKAVVRNFPEKVKILKKLKTHKEKSGSAVQPVGESVSALP